MLKLAIVRGSEICGRYQQDVNVVGRSHGLLIDVIVWMTGEQRVVLDMGQELRMCPECSGVSGLKESCRLCEGSSYVSDLEVRLMKEQDKRDAEWSEQQWQDHGR